MNVDLLGPAACTISKVAVLYVCTHALFSKATDVTKHVALLVLSCVDPALLVLACVAPFGSGCCLIWDSLVCGDDCHDPIPTSMNDLP